jgi:uncharacterized membrane protein
MKRLCASLIAALGIALGAPAAHASLKLCNQTSYVLYAATATQTDSQIFTQGWTRVVPGACRIAIKGDLIAPAYFTYARSSEAHSGPRRVWDGATNICARDTDFSFHLPLLTTQCPSPEMSELPFAPVSTQHMRSWTITFRETPAFDSMKSAERAGLRRLFGDLGARVDVYSAGSDKALDLALESFRKRMHLSDRASTADLFGALETEAMKSATPLGYAICNDTDKPFWAALGEKKGAVSVARGWWMVAAGSCAKAITQSVAKRKIFLRVEKSKGVALISGPEKFCVTDIEFEIQGREHCAARGLIEADFAETNTTGAAGFTAHISEAGLVAMAGAVTPK